MLHNKPEITPVVTRSNTKGCTVNNESSDTNESIGNEKNIIHNKHSCSKSKSASTCATRFSKKRRLSIVKLVLQKKDIRRKCKDKTIS